MNHAMPGDPSQGGNASAEGIHVVVGHGLEEATGAVDEFVVERVAQ
ncbi:hypothetical protein [Actinomadura hibisca]|nr:hypothetical protein [Actinomadura hibisca]